jgi:putative Holliday junction resolvase
MMGIDYGEKRVGIALSDAAGHFAFPKTILPNNDQLLSAIDALAHEEGVELVVVGESDNPAGGMNTIMRRIQIFSEAVQVRTGLKVEAESEAYTSAYARRALEERTPSRKTKSEFVDSAAAAAILQAYIDKTRHAGSHVEQQ